MALLLVRNGGVDDRNLYQVLLCILGSLSDGCGNLICLSKTITYNTVSVTYHYDSGKAEVASTLGDLSYPLDGDESVLELKFRCLYSFYICICHSLNY